MVAAVMAPRTSGFTPNIRPNTREDTSPGTIKLREFIGNST